MRLVWRVSVVAPVVLTMLPRTRTGTNTAITFGYDEVLAGAGIPYNGRLMGTNPSSSSSCSLNLSTVCEKRQTRGSTGEPKPMLCGMASNYETINLLVEDSP